MGPPHPRRILRAAALHGLLLAAASNPVLADINLWTTHGPGGGVVNALAIDPTAPGTLVAGTHGGGVYITTGGGDFWSVFNAGLTIADVNAVAIDPVTPTTRYAATDGGVFKSTDSVNWVAAGTPTLVGVRALAIDPTAPDTLYAGTFGGLFKSTDAGDTWGAVALDANPWQVYTLALDPSRPETLYVQTFGCGGIFCVFGPLFKSTDGGATWKATGSTGIAFVALAIDPTGTVYGATYGGVFKSTDGGATWTGANQGLTNVSVSALAIDPRAPETLYAGASPVTNCDYTVCPGTALFKSTNGGRTWNSFDAGLPRHSSVAALCIDPTAPETIYAGLSGGGVFKSTDGGATWQAVNLGLADISVEHLALAATGTLYAAAYGSGLFKSVGGGPWEVTTPTPSGIYSVAVDPIAADRVYVGTASDGIFASTDGGSTWSGVHLNDGFRVYSIAIDPQTPSTLYASLIGFFGIGSVFKSTDSGATWQDAGGGMPPGVVTLAIDPLTPDTLYAGTFFGLLFKSTDAARRWTVADKGLTRDQFVHEVAIDPTTPTTVYAATDGGVFKSTDGGGSWDPINVGLPDTGVAALAIDPTAPGTLYAGTKDEGVFRSTNGGDRWNALNVGLRNPHVQALAFDPPNRLLYAATQGGVFDIQLLPPSLCMGDCNSSGEVRIEELLTLVSISLGAMLPPQCPFGGPSGGAVDIASLVEAVNNLLSGCDLPTPTATGTSIGTATATPVATGTPTAPDTPTRAS